MFRKDIEASCAYCRHGRPLGNGDVICLKKGIVSVAYSCNRFKYDPFKREPDPPQALNTDRLREEDFQL